SDKAAPRAAKAYTDYYKAFDSYDKAYFGSEHVHSALQRLVNQNIKHAPPSRDDAEWQQLQDRMKLLTVMLTDSGTAKSLMNRSQRQFFTDHCELPLHLDFDATRAAIM